MKSFITKFIISLLLFSLCGCVAYQDWLIKIKEDQRKTNAMNQALQLCDSARWWDRPPAEEEYNRYTTLKKEADDIWLKYKNKTREYYSGYGTRGDKTSYADMIADCENAMGTAVNIYRSEQEKNKLIAEENRIAASFGYNQGIFGYQDKRYDAGITDFIEYVYNKIPRVGNFNLDQNIREAKVFLVKLNLADRQFKMWGIVNNYAIYRYFDHNYQLVQIALVMDKKSAYLEGSTLSGRYFGLVGTKKLKIAGKLTEVLVFKDVIKSAS